MKIILITIAICSILSSTVQASTSAISFSDVTSYSSGGSSQNIGFQFSTNKDINVTALGFFDYYGTFTTPHEVGIYSDKGNLLVSVTVNNSSPVDNFFKYAPVSIIRLNSGENYYIAANTGSEAFTSFTTGFSTSPDINFLSAAYDSHNILGTTVLSFPQTLLGGFHGYFGPNFKEELAVVPLPNAVLLFGTGLVGFLGVRFKRKR